MSDKKIWIQTELTCRPLDTLEEVSLFLQDPPAWRSLCKKIIPHSPNAIRNCDLNQNFGENILETPQSFCHYEPQTEDIDVEHHDRKKLPKTLVCHDMANGYHDDSYVDGTGNSDAYTLYHWGAVDVFCYFSHHFVTVPPLGWINVAHQHGVKVLGTVITEWTSGAALWERILASEQQSQDFASALVAIAQALHFDGWLLNVENKISKPQQLLQFVRQLRQSLHRELEAPLLLWYDSVTVDGHLSWQNGLNHKNKAFFDASDGLFTNYSWSEQDVRSSAELAGERVGDLYVGVDVWGRNFYGGGQFNTQQAVQVVHKHGCSLALFAPAWTHEALSEEADDVNSVVSAQELDQYDKFLLRDRALWCSLWPFLCTKLPDHLPFQTSFCRGQGRKRRLYGEVICPVPWYNLRHMQYQPNSALGPHGYLLSTRDNILGLSRLGLLQNKTGILRCRRSLKENSKVEFAEKTNSEVLITVKTDSLTIITQEETKEVEITSNDSKSSTTKTKIIDVLRNLFRAKGTKITENKSGAMKRKLSLDAEEKQEIIDTAEEIQRKDSSENEIHEISGRSMIQMSVNLRLRDKTQKTRYALAYVSGELQCLEPFFEDSFLGGSCLKINPSDEVCTEHRHSRLFHCDFLCEESLIACVVTKKMLGHEDQFLNVRLHLQDNSESYKKAVLVGRDIPRGHEHEQATAADVVNLYPLSDADDAHFREMQKYMVLHEPDFYVSVANAYGWRVRYYQVELPQSRVTSVSVQTGLPQGPVLLGHFGLCARRVPRSTASDE
ncbi:uncharacterized protein LOC112051438 isoform X2 [Bicyclus anynana]|uniref:Uncharacterized protein LOC112051438 isoform X2 n=1 Tax=Bicyclus anynana TaxID=110368 RepID=A0ABM3LM44_BICAN|nr:uncharacterized protein LOC112051438 isoform X2 [Bicyclus anynana]